MFKSIAKEDKVQLFKARLSVEMRYLQGRTAQNKYCDYKVNNDLVLLEIEVVKTAIVHSGMKQAASIFDKISAAGKNIPPRVGIVANY